MTTQPSRLKLVSQKVMRRISNILPWKLVGLLILSSFLLPSCKPNETAIETATLEVTLAHLTMQANLTRVALQTPQLTETPTPPVETSQPTQNPGPQSPTQTTTGEPVGICDKAAPGYPMIDVNIEDGTEMEPGQRFTKIWRLTNVGTCTWTRDYQAIWFFGTRLGDIVAVPLLKNVAPNESVEIEVEMVAPQLPGQYRSDWKLMNSKGETFGIGPAGNATFWVQIQVVQPPTATPAPTTRTPEPPETTGEPDLTITPTQEADVRVSASLTLALNDSVDKDSGEINPENGADMIYQADGIGNNWITPINGSILGMYGNTEPSLDTCQQATMSLAPIAVGSISPGTSLCYRTDTGRFGWLRLITYNESDSGIEVDILTWELPEGQTDG